MVFIVHFGISDRYGEDMLTPLQCRLGRTALSWTVRDLAKASLVGATTVNRFEAGYPVNTSTMAWIRRALEEAGVVVLDPDGDAGPGVRLRARTDAAGAGEALQSRMAPAARTRTSAKALLAGSGYNPRRGGHAPGDLRDAFAAALDAFAAWKSGEPEPTVELRDEHVPISVLFGLLWNCKDILPGHVFEQVLGLVDRPLAHPMRRTYGAASRCLKQMAEEAHVGAS